MAGIVQKNESIKLYNDALCQRGLDALESGGIQGPLKLDNVGGLTFFKVKGITRFWDEDQILDAAGTMSKIISGISSNNMIFVFVLEGSRTGITLRIGVSDYASESAQSMLQAIYRGAELEECGADFLTEYAGAFGGVMTGCPSAPDPEAKEDPQDYISTLSRAMLGTEFLYVTIARGLSPIQANLGHDRVLTVLQEANSQVSRSITGGTMGNESIQLIDFNAQDYLENLKCIEKVLNEGCNTGLWRSVSYYAVKEREDYQRLVNALKMTFGGSNSKPQRIRCLQVKGIGEVINQMQMISNIDGSYPYHPAGAWTTPSQQTINLYVYQVQNILAASQLSILTALPLSELPGYYVDDYVAFDTSMRKLPDPKDRLSLGQIMQAGREDRVIVDNPYYFDVSDLNRHGLIIGITGGGKTNTSKYLLGELWRTYRKPFLVIESAKREYWELMNLPGFEDLMLFTLGSEEPGRSIRYRINPFEVVGTVSLQTHIDYLLSTFKAAFELYPPMPYVLETSVYEVYQDRGWDIVTNKNTLGLTDYPTLTDLYRKIDVVTDSLGYHQEAKENTKAALKARINSLRIGGKGAMMDTRRSVPIEKLLSTPAVLELEDLGDDDTKAFVIGMVLVQLYEYRKSTHLSGQAKLVHLTMIEEAHRLLKRVPEGGEGGNPRAKSVEFFCNLLAEIRSFGQGFLIADQIPTKLASDTLKNTNLKIVHRIVMEEDRQAIGRAMHMSDEQINYLSALRRGYAAVYAEGDNHPKMIRFPLVKNQNADPREVILQRIRKNVEKSVGEYDRNYNEHFGCTYCERQCQWKTEIQAIINAVADARREKQQAWLKETKYSVPRMNGTVDFYIGKNVQVDFSKKICLIGSLLEQSGLSESEKAKAMANYIRKGRR